MDLCEVLFQKRMIVDCDMEIGNLHKRDDVFLLSGDDVGRNRGCPRCSGQSRTYSQLRTRGHCDKNETSLRVPGS